MTSRRSSVSVTQQRDIDLLRGLAHHFNLTFTAFGKLISPAGSPAYGTLTLDDAFGHALEPAPVTPTGEDAVPYRIISGTIKATYNAHRSLEGGDNVIVTPAIMSGNTGAIVIC